MPRADGSIVIDTKIDDSGLKSGLNDIGKTVGGAAGTIGKLTAGAIGGATAAMGAGLAAVSVKGVQLASDLQEVQNVVDVAFGKSAGTINDFAKNAATQFGLSELSAKKFTGTMGAMLKSSGLTGDAVTEMSAGVAGLAGDFASFYNLDTEDAFDKIRAGISGETEPLKQLGINMSVANLEAFALSEGIDKSFNSMTQAEQATLRYNYLMEASADAQGDFARTSDSFANQQRIMQLNFENIAASIGSKLMPGLTDVTSGLSAIFAGDTEAGVEKLTAGFATLGESLGTVVSDIAGPLMDGLGSALSAIIPMLPGLILTLVNAIIPLLPMLTGALIQGFLALAQALPTILPQIVVAMTGLIVSIATALPEFIGYILDGAIALFTAIVDALPIILPALITALVALVLLLSEKLPEFIPLLLDAAVQLITAIAEAFPIVLPAVLEAVWNLVAGILGALWEFIESGDLLDVGKDLVEGLWNGIDSMGQWIKDKIGGFGEGVLDSLKDFFGIASPSKLFEKEIGVNLALGVGKGFDRSMKDVTADMSRSVSMEMGRFALGTPQAASVANTTVNFNQPVRSFGEMIAATEFLRREVAF